MDTDSQHDKSNEISTHRNSAQIVTQTVDKDKMTQHEGDLKISPNLTQTVNYGPNSVPKVNNSKVVRSIIAPKVTRTVEQGPRNVP